MKNIILILLFSVVISYARGKKELSVLEANRKKKLSETTENNKKESDVSNYFDKRDRIIKVAKSKLGSPYLWGASGTDNFDCSSFVQYVYRQALNVNLPRVSYEQSESGKKINRNIKVGDLLFFETLNKGRISHVGIYVGNNQFIHASSAYKKVVISEFAGFYKEKFRWAVTIL